jgi:hypothetical protein
VSNNDDNPGRLHGVAGALYAKEHLVKVKVHDVNWRTLWRNPQTGEYWKECFPQSEMHGGGLPEFAKITEAQAKEQFGRWQ